MKTDLSPDKERALDTVISQIDRQFGKGSIMRLGENHPRMVVGVVPTGAITVDVATGIGGIPRGRVTEIFGPESSGKTTLVQHVIAEAQKQGGVAAFIDAEHVFDYEYAKKCGVNVEDLYISQPDTGEQALEIAEALVRSGALDVVAVDSVAALVPRSELDGEMGDSHVGLQARLMSQALRKLTGAINRSKTAMIFTNQLREKIGIQFGNPETTPGGAGTQILLVGPIGHTSNRTDQARRRGHRQPGKGKGGKEQSSTSIQGGGVRHSVQRRHIEGRRIDRPGRRDGVGAKEWLLLLIWRHENGAGARECAPISQREYRDRG